MYGCAVFSRERNAALLLLIIVFCVNGPAWGTCPDPDESYFEPRIAVSPCNQEPGIPESYRLRYNAIVRDSNGDPIEDFDDIALKFYPCADSSPILYPPDSPSDSEGHLTWYLYLIDPVGPYGSIGCPVYVVGGGTSCSGTLYTIEGYDAQTNPTAGLRRMDENGSGLLDLSDLAEFRKAFVDSAPVYRGDWSRDNLVGLYDLTMFQVHYTNCDYEAVRYPGGLPDLADNDSEGELLLYSHLTDRLEEGSSLPIVHPDQAVNSVHTTGPNGRDMTLILYAANYSLSGLHVKWDWPGSWAVEGADTELLDNQLLGYAGTGVHDRSYAAAFDPIHGREPRPVARLDLHVGEDGAIAFSRSFVPRYVDSDGTEHLLLLDAQTRAVPPPHTDMHLVRLSSSVSGGAGFVLIGSAGEEVSGAVYDVSGRAIKELPVRDGVNGGHYVEWDGQSQVGRSPAGVYFVMVTAGGQRFVERVLIVR